MCCQGRGKTHYMTIPNDYEYFEEVILHILFLWKDRGFQKSGQLQLIYVTNIHNQKIGRTNLLHLLKELHVWGIPHLYLIPNSNKERNSQDYNLGDFVDFLWWKLHACKSCSFGIKFELWLLLFFCVCLGQRQVWNIIMTSMYFSYVSNLRFIVGGQDLVCPMAFGQNLAVGRPSGKSLAQFIWFFYSCLW